MMRMMSVTRRYRMRTLALLLATAALALPVCAARLLAMDLGFCGINEDLVRGVLHFAGYGSVAVLLAVAMGGQWLIAATVTAVLSGLEEIHQAFVPGRYCDLADWFCNLGGIVCLIVLAAVAEAALRTIRRRRRQIQVRA